MLRERERSVPVLEVVLDMAALSEVSSNTLGRMRLREVGKQKAEVFRYCGACRSLESWDGRGKRGRMRWQCVIKLTARSKDHHLASVLQPPPGASSLPLHTVCLYLSAPPPPHTCSHAPQSPVAVRHIHNAPITRGGVQERASPSRSIWDLRNTASQTSQARCRRLAWHGHRLALQFSILCVWLRRALDSSASASYVRTFRAACRRRPRDPLLSFSTHRCDGQCLPTE